jgi:hypothetical protein
VSLCFFGAADENLTKSDHGMGFGKISIQLQRMFTLGDALRRALSEYVNESQVHMCARMVRRRGQGFSQLGLGRCKGRRGIGHEGICALESVHACRLWLPPQHEGACRSDDGRAMQRLQLR